MRIPKKYGQSRIDKCPFCGQQSVTVNKQKIPVCSRHKDAVLDNLKCICGEPLDIMHGKFGVFFNCFHCGNMNLRKALEINEVEEEKIPDVKDEKKAREETVTSDDPRYF